MFRRTGPPLKQNINQPKGFRLVIKRLQELSILNNCMSKLKLATLVQSGPIKSIKINVYVPCASAYGHTRATPCNCGKNSLRLSIAQVTALP